MADADFISFGDIDKKQSFDGSKEKRPRALRPPSHMGGTKEERKAIAREIRLTAKREKKKIKADAKRQRKENAIMNRRMTKNPEKYNKNAERNRLRAIDQERTRIRSEAVRQAERLAAKHDPSGKMFNVGPVIVLPDGRVKSKEAFERAEEARKARECGDAVSGGNVNPERAAQISTNPKISKKQQKRMAMLQPGPVPPKPTIPAGVALPEGEENWLALWDVDDAEIENRIARQKNEKKKAAKALRRKQKEQKKFNRALKVKKKEAANKGVIFDPEMAKREILGELSEEEESSEEEETKDTKEETKAEKSSSEDSDSDSSSDDSSDSDSDSDSKGGVKIEEPAPKPKRKRSISEAAEDEPEAKKAKSSTSDGKPKKKPSNRPKFDRSLLTDAGIAARVEKEKHRQKLASKRIAKIERKVAEGDVKTLMAVGLMKKKGGKKEETPEERDERRRKRAEKKARIEAKRADPKEQERRERLREGYRIKKEQKKEEKREARRLEKIRKAEEKRKKSFWGKKRTGSTGQAGAEQWNPDALGGDAARKDKFLRLLGAGKAGANGNGEVTGSSNKKTPKVDIEKIQSELERQYDAGMKMKHEGGGKRRGLGA